MPNTGDRAVMRFCEAVCSGEDIYGELLLDIECYLECLAEDAAERP